MFTLKTTFQPFNFTSQSVQHETFLFPMLTNNTSKNYNIFQMTRFNHTVIFFKLINWYKLGDIYISHNNCLGHMLIT